MCGPRGIVFAVALGMSLGAAGTSGQPALHQAQDVKVKFDSGGRQVNYVEVVLDDTGIATWRFLNRRNPAHVLKDLQLEFENEAIGQPNQQRGHSALDDPAEDGAWRKERAMVFAYWLRTLVPEGADEGEDWELDEQGKRKLGTSRGQCDAAKKALARVDPKPVLPRATKPFLRAVLRSASPDGKRNEPLVLRFSNRSVSRALIVTLKVPLVEAAACKDGRDDSPKADWKAADKLCVVALKVEPLNASDVDLWQVARVMALRRDKPRAEGATGTVELYDADQGKLNVPSQQPVEFSVQPFDVENTLARSSGFFTFVHPAAPADSRTVWDASLTASYERAPSQPALEIGESKPPLFSPDHPYDDQRVEHLPATGKLVLARNLSDRAAGKVTLGFKTNDLGTAASTSVEQYMFTVNGWTGASLDVGKFEFAVPSGGIAINEAGEGARLNYRFLSLGHILKRESAEGKADARDEDQVSWIAEARAIPRLGAPLDKLSLTFVRGRDDCPTPSDPKKQRCLAKRFYQSYGGDLYFGVRGFPATGTLAYYRSRAWKDDGGRDVDLGRGDVWLASLTYAHATRADLTKPLRVKWSANVRLGQGSSDKPSTADVDESYVGENKPAFLGALLGGLRGSLAEPAPTTLGVGLANKTYASAEVKLLTGSPLRFVADLFHTPESDIASASTTIRYHRWRLRQPLAGRHEIGSAFEIAADIETPKGIRWAVTCAWLRPDGELERYFKKDPWSVKATVTLVTGD